MHYASEFPFPHPRRAPSKTRYASSTRVNPDNWATLKIIGVRSQMPLYTG
ncbi:MAG: hypothetical protein RLO19_20720 [Coleofasciculus sp. G2-EDA-02]